jgi:hypothetical protein
MRRTCAGLIALALVAAAGCKKSGATEPPAEEPPEPEVVVVPRTMTLDTPVLGLSGLSRDEHGALWAPAERPSNSHPSAVLRIDPDTGGITAYPVKGVPSGADLESIAWIDGTRFVLGTERGESGRARDVILEARLDGETLVASPIGNLEYSLWGITATTNHGIEGLCSVGGTLVVATELHQRKVGRRWAPLAVYEPTTQTWTAHWVALVSENGKGKLAGIDCRAKGDAIEVLAIERDIEVRKLLRFAVPRGPVTRNIDPDGVTTLDDSPVGPNFEGLVWMPDGSVVLVNDNQLGRAQMGSTQLHFIAANDIR